MVRDKHNVIPFSMALVLHALVFGALFVVLDFGDANRPAMPLAIKGTLVTNNAVVIPPQVQEAPPPVEIERPAPEPDTSEAERRVLEEQKRVEDARIEQERVERIRQQEAEQKRLAAEAERKRKADEERRRQEEQRRSQEAEAEKERQRVEAERKREAEIQRQREENERLRREAQSTARQAEIDAEANRLAAVDAGELAAYRFALQQKVERNWVRPASSPPGLECEVRVQQLPGGEVTSVSILTCNGDEAVRRSIEAAIQKASPLPTPRNPSLFDRNLRFTFRPEQ